MGLLGASLADSGPLAAEVREHAFLGSPSSAAALEAGARLCGAQARRRQRGLWGETVGASLFQGGSYRRNVTWPSEDEAVEGEGVREHSAEL
mmetsp:Transcript_70603/g.210539  ORF Transcript_70603/g.210539 Transcript_70603/m.210539 type:complete len:92 (+) Transcript_70603:196-471(+)